MNKKQIIVMSILVLLMLILGITQSFFKETFREVALVENGITEFDQYSFEDGKYKFSLPSGWIVSEKQNQGEYISYKADFKDKENKITGYLQVMDTQNDLGTFAEDDLKNIPVTYKNEQIIPFKVENISGVLSQYKTTVQKGYTFENICYYLNNDDGKIIKILFNIKEDYYKENITTVFKTIVSKVNTHVK